MDLVRDNSSDIETAGNLGGKAMGLLHLVEMGANVPSLSFIRTYWNGIYHRRMVNFKVQPKTMHKTLSRYYEYDFDHDFKDLKGILDDFDTDSLAIRSSMLGEDGAEFFAGQLESFYFKREKKIFPFYTRVLCSAFQHRVLTYRERAGLIPQNIQRLLCKNGL